MQVLKKRKINSEEKQRILTVIKNFLITEKTVLFAYLYGSFLEGTEFNDIDIAIYFDKNQFENKSKIFNYGFSLCSKIEDAIRNKEGRIYEIDLHPLNLAPLGFRFAAITEGKLLVAIDDDARVDFEVMTRDLYFDFLPHIHYYYRTMVLGENL